LTIGPFVPGFSGPFAIVVSPDGFTALITNFGSNDFSPFGTSVEILDLTTNTIATTVNGGIQPAAIAITTDGKFAYFTNYNTLYAGADFTGLTTGQGTVNVIDLSTRALVIPTILVGQSPSGIAITPDGKFILVTNYTSNTVTVVPIH